MVGFPGVVRILHVEDSSADATLVRRLLAKSTLDVDLVHCTTKEAAIAQLAAAPVDLVLLDDYLGIVRGKEALEALIAAGYGGPTIMLSGVVPDQAEKRLAHLKCDIWLDKNRLDVAVLTAAIERATRAPRT